MLNTVSGAAREEFENGLYT